MNYTASLQFNCEKLSSKDLYDLFQSEDFDFQGKKIEVEVKELTKGVNCNIRSDTLHELKIAINAIINSMSIIEKTIEVVN
ncbi:MAG: hypothetical protein HF967_09045 [Methanosarcinales archaeon]|nr:hypothetical protein [Methanosarcinales archaeon]